MTPRRQRKGLSCRYGHPYTPENTYLHPTRNERRCKTCIRQQQAQRRQRDTHNPMPAFVHVLEDYLHRDRGDTRWMAQAACIDSQAPDLFYANPQRDHRAVLAALADCAGCPVANECLTFALENDEPYGIWGGLTARQRHKLGRSA